MKIKLNNNSDDGFECISQKESQIEGEREREKKIEQIYATPINK